MNAAVSNYSSGTVEFSRHSGKALTFDASYTFTRDLSNAGGATPNAFAVAGGSFLTDRFHPGLDYGNVIYDRRHRFLATYLYDLPFGHGQRWLTEWRSRECRGRRLAAGRGHHPAERAVPHALRADRSIRPTPTSSPPSARRGPTSCPTSHPMRRSAPPAQWLNPGGVPLPQPAELPAAIGIGRFGNAPVGGVVGPGTANFSLSLMKNISVAEQSKLPIRRGGRERLQPSQLRAAQHAGGFERLRLHHRAANRRRRGAAQPGAVRADYVLSAG